MDNLDKSGIYQITNSINGKIYIGSAVNILKRWYRHKTHANGNYHHSITFQRAWNLYGSSAFTIKVLEYCNKEKLAEREQFWLDNLQPFNSSIGYNICDNSTTKIGMKRSEQAKENMRQAQLGNEHSQETKELMSIAHRNYDKWPCFRGSRCSCDRCKKIRANNMAERRKSGRQRE